MSGCHIVLFTIGRETLFGSFVPRIKITTNSRLAEFKSNRIDFNAGQLLRKLDHGRSAGGLHTLFLDTCDGRSLKHEEAGFKEVAAFKTGVTLQKNLNIRN